VAAETPLYGAKSRKKLLRPTQRLHNSGGRFEDVTASAGRALQIIEASRGAAFGDVDNDGDTDVLVGNGAGPTELLLNNVGSRNHWLGLRLVTPPTFLKAISEGTEPTAADKTTVDRQIADGLIKVWVYNSQNSTPDVKRITDAARKRGIPVTTITETLVPASASFQDWQSRQLQALAAALAQARGR